MAGTMMLGIEWNNYDFDVSMESGLDGRNNLPGYPGRSRKGTRLNGVRPRWPEQCSW